MSIETEKNRGPTQWEAGKATQKRAIRASLRMPRRCLRPVHAVQCYLVNWGEPTTSTETCEPWYLALQWFDVIEEVNVSSKLHAKRWTTELTERDRMFLRKLGMQVG